MRRLRARGLGYPGAHSKSPWPGHDDLAVNDKTFAYLSSEGEPFSLSCKLPHSGALALLLPGASPTPYGLGKSGWVNLKPPPGAPLDEEMLAAWIDESYRAQAPRRLVKELDARAASVDPVRATTAPRKVAPAKAAPKKVAPAKAAPKKVAPAKAAPKKAAPAKAAPRKAGSSRAAAASSAGRRAAGRRGGGTRAPG